MSMHHTVLAFRSCTAAAIAALVGTSAMASNLVTDPGFELNALTTATNSLNNFPGFQGVWGQENSTIVGVDGGITPASGLNQLRMDITGGVTTQAFQTIDVSSYATLIDSGFGIVNASALYNAPQHGAIAGVYVSYFSGNTYGTLFGPLSQNVQTLDGSPSTWESISLSDSIPTGTRWMLMQVAFDEASLQQVGFISSGYVDDAFLEIVPSPGAAMLLGAGGLAASARRRRENA